MEQQPAADAAADFHTPVDFDSPDTSVGDPVPVEGSETPKVETPAAEPKVETPPADGEGEGEADGEEAVDPEVSEAARKLAKSKRNPQARIDQAVAKQRDAERIATAAAERATALEAELQALKDGKKAPAAGEDLPPAETVTTAAEDAALKSFGKTPDDFDTHEQYVAALATHISRETLAAERTAERVRVERDTADRATQDILAKHAARVEAARASTPDFDARLADIQVSQLLFRELVQSDFGPQMALHLADNPEEAARISALSPKAMVKEVGRLEARTEAAAEPATKPCSVRAVPQSKAPAPMKPVGGGAAAATTPLDQLDVDAYIERRNAEIAAAGKRR